MKNEKTFVAAFLGLVIMFLSFSMLIASALTTVFVQAFQYIGVNALPFTAFGIAGIVLSIIGIFLGAKLFLDNQTPFTKLLFGLAGVYFTLLGIAIAIVGVIGAPETGGITFILMTVFGGFLIISMGLAFLSYGFGIKPLSFFGGLVDAFKKFIDGVGKFLMGIAGKKR